MRYAYGQVPMMAPGQVPFAVAAGRDPLNAQKFKTQRQNQPEDYWQPLYDRSNIATAIPTQVSYFALPKGQSGSLITSTNAAVTKVKTYRDTNMDSAAVATTKLFKVVGVSLGFVHGTYGATAATNEADRATVLNAGYIQFRIVDKDILYLPLKAFPLIDPTVAMSSTANNTTVYATGSGGGPSIPMLKLAIPVTINPFENFLFNMNFDAAPVLTNTLDMYVFLHAYMRRPG